MKLYQVDTGYACAGVVVENDIVMETAPIFKWMIGKDWSSVSKWKKIVKIEEVKDA